MLQPSDDQQLDRTRIESEKSLSQFLELGKYHDYSLIDCNGNEHKVHRVILACHSDYFQTIFDSSFSEAYSHECRLTFSDERNVLPDILKYMYTGSLMISHQNIVPLLNQSEYYQITELSAKLREMMEKIYFPKHVLTILKDAVEFEMNEIIVKASAVLAENFDAVEWDEEEGYLNFLPMPVLLDILANRALTLDTEYRVYKIVANYTKVKYPLEISEQDCEELYSKVFFENLTLEQLEEVFENKQVPREILCKSLFICLRMALGKPLDQERLGRKYTKHMDTKRGRDFCYQTDFDTNGVVYWLGTQLDETTFRNPHKTGHVKCSSSSMQTGEISNIVSRQDAPTWTASEHGAFMQIDLGPSNFVLKPTHYTLKHGYSRDNVNLQHWRFEGSSDGENWDILRVHSNDTSLGGSYGTHTWAIDTQKWYRCFRVIVQGKYFVQVAGIELYGNLLPRTLEAAFKSLEIDKSIE